MRLGRVRVNGRTIYAMFEGEEAIELEGSFLERIVPTSRRYPLAGVKLLAPVEPRQMLGAGVNFRQHLAFHAGVWGGREAEMPAVPSPTLKPVSSLLGPGEPIVLPRDNTGEVTYEAEVLAILGVRCRRVSVEEAARSILGYTCGNDVHDIGWTRNDLSVWRGKGQDTFSPIGPWIETDFDPRSPEALARLRIDGAVVHETRLADMVFGFPELISYLSRHITLEPGDGIWSGAGDSVLARAGQVATVVVPGIGELTNPVEDEA